MWIMNLVVSVSISVSSLVMMLFQFVKNLRYKKISNVKSEILPWILLSLVTTVLVNTIASRTLTLYSLMLDVVLAVSPILFVSSSFWNMESMRKLVCLFPVLDISLIFYYVMSHLGFFPLLSPEYFLCASFIVVIILVVMIITGIWRFLYNAKLVLRSGSVWYSVSLSVEMVYLIIFLAIMCAIAYTSLVKGNVADLLLYVEVVLLWLMMLALSFRILGDNMMVFFNRMERRIMESLKVSAVEVPNDVTKNDKVYQEIYDRIVSYFEVQKPYLRSDLMMDDLVKEVFSNKLYISRAISQITGRNFCQFVNYYRVMHSIETFRSNPELNVTELAHQSGFNSLVSYSMAFRLYMNENPSDWIRKERNRMSKHMLKSIN